MIIGQRIRKARKEKGLSQEELGSKIGVSKVSICGYEKGTRTPTIENFEDLLRILELEPDYILGREKTVVSESDTNYTVKMSNIDIQIINEIKKNRELYNKMCEDPLRTIELINRKMK